MIVSRRPYDKFVSHAFVGRQVSNEEELVTAIKAIGDVEVELVDLVHLTAHKQLARIAATDVLVGMHGAALTYAVHMSPGAGVVEMWPKDRDMWRCFEHLARMAGLRYDRWENRDPSRFRSD